MNNPHLAVSYIEKFPPERFVRFSSDVEAPSLNILIESRPEPGPFAALEWLIPTAVIVYIAKSYFESFLKEMGKDHYVLLKKGLRNLGASLLGNNAPQIRLIGTAGKIDELEIHWPAPSRKVDKLTALPINSYIRIVEGKGIV